MGDSGIPDQEALKGEVLPYIRHEAATTLTQRDREKKKIDAVGREWMR
jgi:hypothetical protein